VPDLWTRGRTAAWRASAAAAARTRAPKEGAGPRAGAPAARRRPRLHPLPHAPGRASRRPPGPGKGAAWGPGRPAGVRSSGHRVRVGSPGTGGPRQRAAGPPAPRALRRRPPRRPGPARAAAPAPRWPRVRGGGRGWPGRPPPVSAPRRQRRRASVRWRGWRRRGRPGRGGAGGRAARRPAPHAAQWPWNRPPGPPPRSHPGRLGGRWRCRPGRPHGLETGWRWQRRLRCHCSSRPPPPARRRRPRAGRACRPLAPPAQAAQRATAWFRAERRAGSKWRAGRLRTGRAGGGWERRGGGRVCEWRSPFVHSFCGTIDPTPRLFSPQITHIRLTGGSSGSSSLDEDGWTGWTRPARRANRPPSPLPSARPRCCSSPSARRSTGPRLRVGAAALRRPSVGRGGSGSGMSAMVRWKASGARWEGRPRAERMWE